MAKEKKRASALPEDMTDGGGFDDIDVVLKNWRVEGADVPWSEGLVTMVMADMENEDGESLSEFPLKLSVGRDKGWKPTDDGTWFEHDEGKEQIDRKSSFGAFSQKGCDASKAFKSRIARCDVTALDGLHCHIKKMDLGLVIDGKKVLQTVPTEVYGFLEGDGGGSGSGKPKPKPRDEDAGGEGGGSDEDDDGGGEGGGDEEADDGVQAKVMQVVVDVLREAGEPMTKADLSKAVARAMARDKDGAEGKRLCWDSKFLKEIQGTEFDGRLISLPSPAKKKPKK